jgi:Asp-tRNA(Asn)/Glu-tRNA(Gln) amidotransferase A subunit family amidase
MPVSLDLDASRLAVKIREGRVRPSEAVEAAIEQIEKTHSVLNALVEKRFGAARKEAKQHERKLAEGKAFGRLFGVPISVKECFFVEGMKTTSGLTSRRDSSDREDAEIIRRLKREGAIILGKTNTPALCFCQETENNLFGRTNNPWNPERTAGGSSGGEGALIAVGGAFVGIGADIGGSIRFPAHFCGVIGFKSGMGQVPDRGIFPPVEEPIQKRMLGIGALAKSVEDARLIHEILADSPPSRLDLSSFRVMVPDPDPHLPLSDETAELLRRLKTRLSPSLEVRDEPPPYLRESALWWQKIMSVDGAEQLVRLTGMKNHLAVTLDWLKSKAGRPSELHPYLSWALIGARVFRPGVRERSRLEQLVLKAEHEVTRYLEKSILILPVYHSAAPHHGKQYREVFSVRRTFLRYMPYISYANVFGLPALTVPVGEDRDGMPVAVQLLTLPGQEDVLFQLGKELERSFRGFVRCTLWDGGESGGATA